jgi:hypothetical protein
LRVRGWKRFYFSTSAYQTLTRSIKGHSEKNRFSASLRDSLRRKVRPVDGISPMVDMGMPISAVAPGLSDKIVHTSV